MYPALDTSAVRRFRPRRERCARPPNPEEPLLKGRPYGPQSLDALYLEYTCNSDAVAFKVRSPCNGHDVLAKPDTDRLFLFPPQATWNDVLSHTDFLVAQLNSVLRLAVLKQMVPPVVDVRAGVPQAHFELHNSRVEKAAVAMRDLLGFEPLRPLYLCFALASGGGALRVKCLGTSWVESNVDPVWLVELAQPAQSSETTRPDYPYEGLDFTARSLLMAVGGYSKMIASHYERHEFVDWPAVADGRTAATAQHGVFELHGNADGKIIIGIAGDWGAGCMESDMVQAAMVGGITRPELDANVSRSNPPDWQPHYTLHLGDIYFTGRSDEVRTNCQGVAGLERNSRYGVQWPHGVHGSFAVPGNHELYSGGTGFFDTFLPDLGQYQPSRVLQKASYWCLRNDSWLLIGLDTGYGSWGFLGLDERRIRLHGRQVDWLRDTVRLNAPGDTRGIVIFSHHQVNSAWGKSSGVTEFQGQVAELLQPSTPGAAPRSVLWLYGHEHRLAVYELCTDRFVVRDSPLHSSNQFPMTYYSRCVGNGGFPAEVTAMPSASRSTHLQYYDDRLYRVYNRPGSDVSTFPIGFNGCARCTIEGRSLTLEYYTIHLDEQSGQLSSQLDKNDLMLRETFSVSTDGELSLVQQPPHPELTSISRVRDATGVPDRGHPPGVLHVAAASGNARDHSASSCCTVL